MTRVTFHPEAEAEFLAAARYYEDQAENLGSDFVRAVELACERLLEFPDLGAPFGSRLRRVLLPRFPYGVVYRREPDRLLVVAVANLYRRPGFWRARS